jgi:hypothetical protein
MEVLIIFLGIVIVTALVVGWLAVCVISLIVRLCVRAVATPFRMAKRADQAVADRFAARAILPRRMLRGDDVQCSNRLCKARLPTEAKFCCRCGTALARQRTKLPALVVDVRSRGISQVA